jgi:L-arabinokinase
MSTWLVGRCDPTVRQIPQSPAHEIRLFQLIAFYISGHGFGHASRCVELINTLQDRSPGLRVSVRSTVAPWLITQTARHGIALERVECDTGILQIDSLRLDEAETLRRATAFMDALPGRIDDEVRALRALGASLVVADIPAFGVAVGRAAGLPTVALGNFSWDWAYAAYDGGADVAERIAAIYRTADLALRLPLWGGFAAFPRVVDLPLIARRARHDRETVRRAFGWPAHAKLALVSFGGYGVGGIDLEALNRIEGWQVLVSGSAPLTRLPAKKGPGPFLADGAILHLDEPAMYARGFTYEDVVRAVDAVVTKPGYGIIAECAANGTAMLYTSRGNFAEYAVLVAGMPALVRSAFIGHDDLYAGRWGVHLDALVAQPSVTMSPRVDGADVAATLLLEML